MEYKRIWMPYKTDFSVVCKYFYPSDDENTEKADNEIAKLLSEGWRIISTAPITGSQARDEKGLCSIGLPEMVYTYTIGIEVFLVKELG
jgi:hypothetical protein